MTDALERILTLAAAEHLARLKVKIAADPASFDAATDAHALACDALYDELDRQLAARTSPALSGTP